MTSPPPLPSDLKAALERAAIVRQTGQRIVTVNGCFDLFHAGHLETLAGAKAHGEMLIVLINSDASIRRLKGPTRPYLEASQRRALLEALRVVDAVVIFDEDTPEAALQALKPDVHVKGGSFDPDRVARERSLLATWGGRLEVLPLRPGISSTELIRRIWEDCPAELKRQS